MAEQYSINFLIKATDQAGKPLKDLSAIFQKLATDVSKTYNVMNKGKRGGGLGGKGAGLGGEDTGLFGGLLGKYGAQAGGYLGGAFALKSMINNAMDFDTAMSKIATRIPHDRDKLLQLSEGVKVTAMNTGKSTDELSRATLDLVNDFQKASSPEIMGRLNAGLKLSKVSFADTAASAEYLAHVTSAYGKDSVQDMNQAAAMTFATLKKADVSLEEFSSTILGMAPNAKVLGISMEEMFSIFSTFADGKEQFQQVGNGLQFMLRAMVKAGPAGKEFGEKLAPLDQAIASLGYRSGKELISKQGFAGAMELLQIQAKNMGVPLEKLVGGGRGMFVAMRMGAKGMKELKETMKGLPNQMDELNAAIKAADEVGEAGKEWNKFKETLKVTGIELGELILPPLTKAFWGLNQVLQANRSGMKATADILRQGAKEGFFKGGFVRESTKEEEERTLAVNKKLFRMGELEGGFIGAKGSFDVADILALAETINKKGGEEQVLRVVLPTDDEGNPLINLKKDKGPMRVKQQQGAPLELPRVQIGPLGN